MAHVLAQLLIVLAASLAAVWVVGRARLPSLVGYLAAGIAIGPHALGLVHDTQLIAEMAEVGVVLLMFTIGLKFSVAELTRMRGLVFGAGAVQVVATIAACVAAGAAFGVPPSRAAFLGFLVAMSSTAIVLKLLEDRGETDSAPGRLATGVLIFQDLAVVPLMLVTPMLAGGGDSAGTAVLKLVRSLVTVVVIVVVARILLPRLFGAVAKTRNREVFTLATILVILATAAASGAADLSLALGALIAGVVLSESEYAHQVLSDVVPLRDLLASLFFVSVGMLVNVSDWVAFPLRTVGDAAAILAMKGAIVWGIARAFGLGPRTAVLAGLAIAQIGEFSFVLAGQGRRLELLEDGVYERFLSASVLTMAVTPFLLMLGPWLMKGAGHLPASHGAGHRERKDHVVVVGYGVSGRNTVSAVQSLGVPVVVLELNPKTVRGLRAAGVDAEFGDASSLEVLDGLGLRTARALVLTQLDPIATRRTVAFAKSLNPSLAVVVRTRFVAEMAELHRLGATVVVPEEFEASIALAAAVMKLCGASERAVARVEAALRGDDYSLVADSTPGDARAQSLSRILHEVDLGEVVVPEAGRGRTLRDLDLRARTGATVVALRRGEQVLAAPGADVPLEAGDRLVILAAGDTLQKVQTALSAPAGDRA